MALVFRWYNRMLFNQPWKSQALTTGALMATSDFIAQTAVEKCELRLVDWLRVGRFAFLGLFYVGPSLRLWYLTLDKIYGTAGKTVGIKKVLTDQCMFSPAFIGSFLIVCGKSQFHTWNEIKQKIHDDYFSILKTSYKEINVKNFRR